MKRAAIATALIATFATGCPGKPGPRVFITDDAGRALVFHGVNLSGSTRSDPERMPWVNAEDVARLSRDWGFNLVRFVLQWDGLEPMRGVFDEDYLARVEERLDWCAAAGLSVILDMHQDGWGKAFADGDGFPAWATITDGLPFEPQDPEFLNYIQPAVMRAFDNFWNNRDGIQDAFRDAWVTLALRFKDHPAVLGYELLNEPFGGTKNLGKFEGVRLAPFYELTIAAIRGVDAESWIFLEPASLGVNFGLASKLPPIAGERIAYMPHFYQPDVETGGAYNGDTFWIDLAEAYRAGEAARFGMPLVFGEIGSPFDGVNHGAYRRDVLAMVDRIGSGWAWWSYDLGDTPFAILDADRSERPGIVDDLVRPYPQRVAGEPTRYAHDPETRVFELAFRETGVAAPTEIYIPAARHYPDGWTLAVSDPDGAWSSAWDPVSEVLRVTTDPHQVEHTVRVTAN